MTGLIFYCSANGLEKQGIMYFGKILKVPKIAKKIIMNFMFLWWPKNVENSKTCANKLYYNSKFNS